MGGHPDGTDSSRFFEEKANEIIHRLEGNASEPAVRLLSEARELVARFRTWAVRRPEAKERVDAVQRLFQIHREALELVTRSPDS